MPRPEILIDQEIQRDVENSAEITFRILEYTGVLLFAALSISSFMQNNFENAAKFAGLSIGLKLFLDRVRPF